MDGAEVSHVRRMKYFKANPPVEKTNRRQGERMAPRLSLPIQLYKGLEYLLRFNCNSISIGSVKIDHSFFTLMTPILKKVKGLQLELDVHYRDAEFQSEEQFQEYSKGYYGFLAALSYEKLTVEAPPVSLYEENFPCFVQELAKGSENAEIRIEKPHYDNWNISSEYIKEFPVCISDTDAISKFAVFCMHGPIFDDDAVIELIKRRLREQRAGELFLNTKNCDYHFQSRLLPMTAELSGDEFEANTNYAGIAKNLRIKGTTFTAHVRIGGSLTLEIRFREGEKYFTLNTWTSIV